MDMLTLKSDSFVSKAFVPASHLVSHLSKYQMGVQSPRIMQDHKSDIVLNASVSSPAAPDMMLSCTNAMTSSASIHGKRESQDGHESSLSNSNKRTRVRHMVADVNYMQHVGTQVDGLHTLDYPWKNALLLPQSVSRAIPYANTMLNYHQQTFQGGLNQEARTMPFAAGQKGIRYNVKKEPAEIERMDQLEPRWTKNESQVGESDMNFMDFQQARSHQILPQQLTQLGFPQITWNGLGQPLETNPWKEYSLQKRKIVQSPCASAGGLPRSPLSSKSGDISGGSVRPQYGAAVANGLTQLMKEKPAATSVPSAGVLTFMTSIANGSMRQQHLPQVAAKRRSSSVPKAPVMMGAGSPAGASNMGLPFYASSPFVGTPPLADQIMLERFSKIKMVTVRFQLNHKKNKVDEYCRRKQNVYPAQQLLLHLSNNSNNENFKDEPCRMALSKSLVGGNMNICTKRDLTFLQTEEVLQGNGFSYVPKERTRMIMSEKPNDGTIAMHIGEMEDAEYLTAEDYLPTLPNAHFADLLAAQFRSLMIREGHLVEDHVQPKPICMNLASSDDTIETGTVPIGSVSEMQQSERVFINSVDALINSPALIGSDTEMQKSEWVLVNSVDALVNSPQNMQGQKTTAAWKRSAITDFSGTPAWGFNAYQTTI